MDFLPKSFLVYRFLPRLDFFLKNSISSRHYLFSVGTICKDAVFVPRRFFFLFFFRPPRDGLTATPRKASTRPGGTCPPRPQMASKRRHYKRVHQRRQAATVHSKLQMVESDSMRKHMFRSIIVSNVGSDLWLCVCQWQRWAWNKGKVQLKLVLIHVPTEGFWGCCIPFRDLFSRSAASVVGPKSSPLTL